jgi:hypothetical protein
MLIVSWGLILKTDSSIRTWSALPLTDAVIRSDGVWEDVLDTNVTLHLENDADIFVSYAITASPLRGNTVLANSLSVNWPDQRCFLQTRLSIDSVPFRQSGSHISPEYLSEMINGVLAGYSAVRLLAGMHRVKLQWKKVGRDISSWGNHPSNADGFSSSRSLLVTARHNYLWHHATDSSARLEVEGEWLDILDSTLSFELPVATPLRILYSMMIRADRFQFETGSLYFCIFE